MAEAKYTAGPYRVEGRSYSGSMLHKIVADSGPWTVAVIETATGPDTSFWEALADANANLLSASPDLHQACLPVLAEAKERADYLHDTYDPSAHVELTLTIAELRAIHAAVAKAEGRAS